MGLMMWAPLSDVDAFLGLGGALALPEAVVGVMRLRGPKLRLEARRDVRRRRFVEGVVGVGAAAAVAGGGL